MRSADAPPLAVAGPGADVRSLESGDREAIASLMAAAYRDTRFLRPFVPLDGDSEWLEYVSQLIDTRGCGECLPEACAVVPDKGGVVHAALLASRLDPQTGHIAQVVVSPAARGTGLASRTFPASLSVSPKACAIETTPGRISSAAIATPTMFPVSAVSSIRSSLSSPRDAMSSGCI